MTATHQHYREACTRCNDKDIEISKLKADLARIQRAAVKVIAAADKMELGESTIKTTTPSLFQTITAHHIFGGVVFGCFCGLILIGAGALLASSTHIQILSAVLFGIAALVAMVVSVARS